MASQKKSAGKRATRGNVAQPAPQTGPQAGPALASTSAPASDPERLTPERDALLRDLGVSSEGVSVMLGSITCPADSIAMAGEGEQSTALAEAIAACVDKAERQLQHGLALLFEVRNGRKPAALPIAEGPRHG